MRISSSRRLWPEVLLVPTLVALISSLVAPAALAGTSAGVAVSTSTPAPAAALQAVATPSQAPVQARVSAPVALASLPALTSQGVILRAPKTAVAGQPFSIDLIVRADRPIAAYETQLLFDTARASVVGLEEHDGLNRTFGAGAVRLGPVQNAQGFAFGAYSVARAGRVPVGRSGTFRLATVDLLATVSGPVQVRLGATRFVNGAGQVVNLANRGAATVSVGRRGTLAGAPRGWALPAVAANRSLTPNITGDRGVTAADLNIVTLGWLQARENGSPCATSTQGADANHDGCVDIQDIQAVAAVAQPASAAAATISNTTPRLGPDGIHQLITTPDTYVVNSTGDQDDSNTADGVCLTSVGTCTLRAAITQSNWHGGPDTIDFNIPGPGVHQITLGSVLPIIHDDTGGVTIDGYSQPGASANTAPLADNAVIDIALYGPGEMTQYSALQIVSSNNVIRGLSIYHFWRKVWLNGGSGNVIAGDFIGTDPTGTYFSPARFDPAFGAIELDDLTSDNIFGGTNLADRNVISGNPGEGIHLRSLNDRNITYNNIFGLNPAGTKALPNWIHGEDINFGSSDNVFGGLLPGQRNVSSGNVRSGVEISHGLDTSRNQVVGNYIGTWLDGNSCTVPSAAAKGVYSGDGSMGIHIEDGGNNSLIEGNIVGCSGNDYLSYSIQGGPDGGISVVGVGTVDNKVINNHVGISPIGTPMTDFSYGIEIRFHAQRTLVTGNVIGYETPGVEVGKAADTGMTTDIINETISQNSFINNVGAPIDLFPIGVNPNDAGDADTGSNNLLNHPMLSGATTSAVIGTSCAGCTVEVYKSDRGANAYGEGATFLGTGTAGSDGRFSVPVTIPPSGLVVGNFVTALAIDPAGDTSEFGLDQVVAATIDAPVGTVTANDTFTRTSTSGFGQAPVGGLWSLAGSTPTDYKLNGTQGTLRLGSASTTRSVTLQSLSQRNIELLTRVKSDKTAVGGNISAYFVARQVAPGLEYRARLRFGTDGSLNLVATKVLGGVETGVGAEVKVLGLTHTANQFYWIKTDISGYSPTMIKIKVWKDGTAEPASWAYTGTDSSAGLQSYGTFGIQGYLASGSTNAPVTLTLDDFSATALTPPPPPAPVANFTSAQVTNTLNVNFTDTSTAAPTSWAWTFGDGGTSTTQNPNHAYAAAGTYSVKLTATNTGGSSSKTLSVVVVPLPPAPVANFSWVQTPDTDAVAFSDSSTGIVSSWAWDFGDGSLVSNAQSPSHIYATTGIYNVKLTATGPGGSDSKTVAVTVSASPVPTAAFTFVQTPNSFDVVFTDTSTNATSWSWNFGDGSPAATVENPTHTYAAGGTYSVTLTATNASGNNAVTRSVPVATPPYALDGFSRTVAGGWGAATFGGTWSLAGTAADFNVNGSQGTINIGTAGATRGAYLGTSAGNVDETFTFSTNQLPVGGHEYIYAVARRQSNLVEYAAKVRLATTGGVYVAISRFNSSENVVVAEHQVAGLTETANEVFHVRFTVTGSSPTTLQVKVWADGTAEPVAYSLTGTDSDPSVQGAGGLGVRAYIGAASTDAPVLFTIDDFRADRL